MRRARGANGVTCESEILSVGRSSSSIDAPEIISFVAGGHGWMVKGPPAEERYAGPMGARTALSLSAETTAVVTTAAPMAAFVAISCTSALAASPPVSSLCSRQRRSWLHCATTLNMCEAAKM